MNFIKNLSYAIALLFCVTPMVGFGQLEPSTEQSDAYIFVRDDCSHCQDLKQFVEDNNINSSEYQVSYLDINQEPGTSLFQEITQIHKTGKVTPISLIGGQVYVGFSPEVVGKVLLQNSGNPQDQTYTLDHYRQAVTTNTSGETCTEGSLTPCDTTGHELSIPVLGTINTQTVSLSFMAITLGFVDGFNPCAMWVLLTFLLILSQIGSKKKMIQIAGLFIVAEGVMYYLILNVWYQTWNFIALDGIVTPLVGILALGSGIYFIYKYWTSRNKALTCDVTSIEHQQKTEQRIQELVSKPLTFAVALAIIALALSVNIIEFACSIGIPQAFTKVLELNNLSFMQYQGYTLLYTLFYMMDDFIVFGLAIWGYQKFYAVGQKYSRYATLVAGVLMLLLGLIMLLNPDLLS